jgi:hypothetical protein
LPSVTTDWQGLIKVNLPTLVGDPEGDYLVTTGSPPGETAAGEFKARRTPLKRNDPPPQGAEPRLSASGAQPVGPTTAGVPRRGATLRPGTALVLGSTEVGEEFRVYGQDFASDKEVVSRVLRPDGVVPLVTWRGDDHWANEPDWPLGLYVITTGEGAERSTAHSTIRPATSPRLLLGRGSGTITLAGVAPRRAFVPHLYRWEGPGQTEALPWRHATSLERLYADQLGLASCSLGKTQHDPPWDYLGVLWPTPGEPPLAYAFHREER